MFKNYLLILFVVIIFILLIRYLKVKQQIKKIEKQLQNQETYLHSLSIELFDKDIEGMTLDGDVLFNISANEHIVLRIENPVNNSEQIDIEHVFDRFYKKDISRNAEGTGLGLSITQLLMKKMGGSISAHIKGNLFVIELVFEKWKLGPKVLKKEYI